MEVKKKLQPHVNVSANANIHVQGRDISASDIALIEGLTNSNPNWSRTRLSRELCLRWNWRNAAGNLKDMSCRMLLLKLEKMGYMELPPGIHSGNNSNRNKMVEPVLHTKELISVELKELLPLQICVVANGYDLKLFKYFISAHNYLGWRGPVGEHLKYFVLDNQSRPLACLMFGASAWKIEPRDRFIGWSPESRVRNLSFIANNNRFLILPWVKVKCLASHILGLISRRISEDWQKKYNHEIYMLETFVEDNRFLGTSYKASNWLYLGKTLGRGRNDVKNEYKLPIKSIWVYVLVGNVRNFREKFCGTEYRSTNVKFEVEGKR